MRIERIVAVGIGGRPGFPGIAHAVEIGVREDSGTRDVAVDAEAMQEIVEEPADLVGHVADRVAGVVEAGADQQQAGHDILAEDAIGIVDVAQRAVDG